MEPTYIAWRREYLTFNLARIPIDIHEYDLSQVEWLPQVIRPQDVQLAAVNYLGPIHILQEGNVVPIRRTNKVYETLTQLVDLAQTVAKVAGVPYFSLINVETPPQYAIKFNLLPEPEGLERILHPTAQLFIQRGLTK